MSDLASRLSNLTPEQRALLELRRTQSASNHATEPVAVIGIGCRFPGATGPESFHRVLRDGVDAITEVPKDRWDIDKYFDPRPETPGKMYTRWGGFIEEIDQFDARFFGIAPREAASMDPQQRLLLEVAWEALEHAGQPADHLIGSRTGVFAGMMTNDYSQLNMAGYDPERVDVYSGSGVDYSFAAGRLSYVLGLQGPSMVVATACSSALVATHLACQSLRAGECELALAGGVNVILTPEATIYSCRIRSMAADGRCKTFDATADGYVRGEGCGVVVLKKLSDAVRDGDNVLALIRGSAINHDGKSAGLTVPNAAAQQAVLHAALANAGVHPGLVGYVEAHGTGTPLGDPIEVRSLWSVLGEGRAHPLLVGSAKTNVGHLEAAAGSVGLIKAVLALQHREIFPNLHLKNRNPYIDWAAMQIDIPTTLMEWPAERLPRIAGVSSFGLSGMNAHVVLEEAPRPASRHESNGVGPYLLPVSARSETALQALAESYAAHLDGTPSAHDVCRTASLHRSHHEHRLAVAGATADELREGLAAARIGKLRSERPKLAFVFPGQGGQHAGMARVLLAHEPVFRQSIEACDRAFRAHADWSLLGLLEGTDETWLDEIDRIQPATFAVQAALAALWKSWGVVPDAVAGHSMGEIAAAHAAGVMRLEYAARIICRRSVLLKRVGGGAMLVVDLPAEEIRLPPGLSIAAVNGPRTTIVSGAGDALTDYASTLERRSVFCKRVQVSVAAHTAQVDGIAPALAEALASVTAAPGDVPFYSTVTGVLARGQQCGPAYWMSNLRQPVQFWKALQAMIRDGHRSFIEISPHPVLGPSIEDGIKSMEIDGAVRPSLRRGEDDRRVMLDTLGALYREGQPIDWAAFYPNGGRRVTLPTYPWQRQRYWIEAAPDDGRRSRASSTLGDHYEFSAQTGTHVWELSLSVHSHPYLADHRIEGQIVVPAAFYIALTLDAARSVFSEAVQSLEDVAFHRVLVLPNDDEIQAQLVIGPGTFRFASRSEKEWTVHATGRIAAEPPVAGDSIPPPAIEARLDEVVAADDYYEALEAVGLEYGPALRRLLSVRRGAGEALANLAPAASIDATVLDACFQALGAALATPARPAVPIGIKRLAVLSRPSPADGLWCHTRSSGPLEGEVRLLDGSGQILMQAEGFQLQALTPDADDPHADWLFAVEWRLSERVQEPTPHGGLWLITGDGGRSRVLARLLEEHGERCLIADAIPESAEAFRAVVHLASDGASSTIEVLRLVQAMAGAGWRDAPRLFLVTSGAQSIGPTDVAAAPDQATLWGLGRTIALEHSEFACTRIDSPSGETDLLARELRAADDEDQIALRNGSRYVARLVRRRSQLRSQTLAPADDRSFRLEIDRPGILDTLVLRAAPRQPVGPDEVEIEVRAAGLNFLDVLAAMGVRPDHTHGPIALGGECSGIVTAAGARVQGLKPGDPVIAIGPHCFGTHVRTPAVLAVAKPAELNFVESAAIPIASLTAYYALVRLGHLRRGERILIHSASGGTGLAAVHLARRIGAEVFATAGSPEKRALLQSLGVDHVMDSRSLAFAAEVRRLTGGNGVDVVLNSLTGDAIAAGLSALAPYGRFLEIGKKDIYQNSQVGLEPFQKNLSYFAIDLARMIPERPEFVREMLEEVVQQYADGSLGLLHVQALPIADAAEAFQTMARAHHTGKIVLTTDERRTTRIAAGTALPVRADATYLITGGLGALGMAVAQWLVQHGARSIVLIGRSAPGPAREEDLKRLRAAGATVLAAQADVSRREDVAAVLARISETLPPLRGVIHAAAVLDDSTLLRLDVERLQKVMQPKIDGARNLHDLTSDCELDFFVLFSSAASILGSPGQGNYAAANAYLDALAQHRRAQGRPALSINWGPWAEIGLAASQTRRGDRLAAQGMASIPPDAGLDVLGRLLVCDAVQVAVMAFDLRHWRQLFPGAARAPFLRELISDDGAATRTTDSPDRVRLLSTPPALRQQVLETMLAEHVARVLRMTPDQIDRTTPLPSLGLDSLTALELRNRLELSFGVTLSATLIWGYPTIGQMAPFLAEKMGVAPPPAEVTATEDSARVSELAQIADEDADALLAQKLAALEERSLRQG